MDTTQVAHTVPVLGKEWVVRVFAHVYLLGSTIVDR